MDIKLIAMMVNRKGIKVRLPIPFLAYEGMYETFSQTYLECNRMGLAVNPLITNDSNITIFNNNELVVI